MNFCNTIPFGIQHASAALHPQREAYLKCKPVIDAVCEYFGISFYGLKQDSNLRKISDPRHLAVYFAHVYNPDLVDREIGEVFNRDRTTVIHSKRTATALIKIDPEFRRNYLLINRKIQRRLKKIQHDLKTNIPTGPCA